MAAPFDHASQEDIKDAPLRGPRTGPSKHADHLPAVPPTSEMVADALTVMGVGHRRELAPAQKIKRSAKRAKKGRAKHNNDPDVALAADPGRRRGRVAWHDRGRAWSSGGNWNAW